MMIAYVPIDASSKLCAIRGVNRCGLLGAQLILREGFQTVSVRRNPIISRCRQRDVGELDDAYTELILLSRKNRAYAGVCCVV